MKRDWCAAARACAAAAALTLGGCAAWLPPPQTAALQAAAARGVARSGPLRTRLDAVPFFALSDAAQARHCGPQALASVLAGLPSPPGQSADPVMLAEQVYLPARGGSLQIEMLAAARRHGALAVQLPGTLDSLFDELDAGHPVLVLQNLGFTWLPNWLGGATGLSTWHYAVVVGHDQITRELILHSGREPGQRLSWATFEYTWARAGHWAVAVLPPGELPPSATEGAVQQAALDFERLAPPADAVRVWRSVVARWPDQLTAAIGLGNALLAAGQPDAAVAALAAAAPRQRSAVLWNNLAQVEIAQRRWSQARAALDQALARARSAEPRWLAEVESTAAALAAAELAELAQSAEVGVKPRP